MWLKFVLCVSFARSSFSAPQFLTVLLLFRNVHFAIVFILCACFIKYSHKIIYNQIEAHGIDRVNREKWPTMLHTHISYCPQANPTRLFPNKLFIRRSGRNNFESSDFEQSTLWIASVIFVWAKLTPELVYLLRK